MLKQLQEKIIRRHPHVFSGKKFKSLMEINSAYEKIKSQEKKEKATKKKLAKKP